MSIMAVSSSADRRTVCGQCIPGRRGSASAPRQPRTPSGTQRPCRSGGEERPGVLQELVTGRLRTSVGTLATVLLPTRRLEPFREEVPGEQEEDVGGLVGKVRALVPRDDDRGVGLRQVEHRGVVAEDRTVVAD